MIELNRNTFLEKRHRQVFSQNSKMKKSKIKETDFVINWLLPEYKSKLYDLITCPTALHCIGDCYVSQGYGYRMPNTRAKMEMNLGLSLSEYFEEDIYKSLKKYKKATHVRIHDSGDFYSKEYLMRWLKIIRDNPKLTFYAYTKRISMFKAIKKYMPENFIIIFSFGGKEDHLIDTESDRHAMVFETKEKMPKEYINASDNDLLAIQGNKKVGLVYHGQKKMKGFKNVG